GDLEKIVSRLASEKHLRVHVLSMIATSNIGTLGDLLKFFGETYLGYLYGSRVIKEKVENVVEFLSRGRFIEVDNGFMKATKLGVRVSQLYIDPLTALIILRNLDEGYERPSNFGLLHLIALTPEIPRIPMKKLGVHILEEYLERKKNGMLVKIPNRDDEFYEEYLDAVRLAMVLEAWIEEMPDSELYDRFGIQPGDMAALRESAEWIAYSASQIAKISGHSKYVTPFQILSERIKHGVREELLPLVRLRGIGRVRARALYRAGYTSIEKLKATTVEDLKRILGIGEKIARSILEQLNT
ncbi:MAG: helix-hairpin-helix domain-containing protein, partial [Nitrososphaerota archaeon]